MFVLPVFDNMSTDRSWEIVRHHGAEIIDNNTGGENRMDIQMHFKNNCFKDTDVDWVVVRCR